jgi:SPP1 gp7 family putative phage head morphogenesis protein
MANVAARHWADQYSGQLIQGISQTTERGVQQAVARFIDNGEPLEALIQDLTPFFGRKRAARIAATEVTRAYQHGSEDGWRQSGVVAQMEWQTVNDEKVCPQCGPMQGARAQLGGTFDESPPPPLHVSCRCFTRPVVEESRR